MCVKFSCGEENHDICTYDDLVIWLLYFGCKYYYKGGTVSIRTGDKDLSDSCSGDPIMNLSKD